MRWTALLPLKPAGERKTRLADVLSVVRRDALAVRLLGHVAGVLRGRPEVSRIVLLAHDPVPGWAGDWIADAGRGLNTELEAARLALGAVPLLVLHADLPLLAADDVAVLTAAGVGGCAIAPDRHGGGTNAIALAAGRGFRFAFGAGSLALHRAQGAALVEREGLALDLDTPEDLALAAARGFNVPLSWTHRRSSDG